MNRKTVALLMGLILLCPASGNLAAQERAVQNADKPVSRLIAERTLAGCAIVMKI